jgi:hypothetical protein
VFDFNVVDAACVAAGGDEAHEPWTCNSTVIDPPAFGGSFAVTLPAGDLPYDVDLRVYSKINATDVWGVADAEGNDIIARRYNPKTESFGPFTIECESEHVPVEVDLICKNVLVKEYFNSANGARLSGLEVTAEIVSNPWFTPEQLAEFDEWELAADGESVVRTTTTNAQGQAIFWDIPADSLVRLEVDPASAPDFTGPFVSYVRFGDDAEFPADPEGPVDTVDECEGIVWVGNWLNSDGQVVGYVFDDFDDDGSPGPDPGEFNQDGINVYLIDCETGQQVQVVQTGENGWYFFTDLEPGAYRLVVDGVSTRCFKVLADDKDRWDFDNLNDIWYLRGDILLNGVDTVDVFDPTFNRPTSGSDAGFCELSFFADNVFFDLPWGIFHPGGPLAIDLIADDFFGDPLDDPFLALYDGVFDPANPCDNLIEANDNGGFGLDSQIDVILPPGFYIAVPTTFANGQTGDYTIRAEK